MLNKKILIIHDRFQYKGGGERLCLIMARALNADILTEYWNETNSFTKKEASGKIFTLGKRFNIRGLGYVSAQLRFFFKTKFIKNYDTIIFSGNNCLSAAWRAPQARTIMYCHTPVRYAYDLKNYYYQKYPWYGRPVFLFFVLLARAIYQWGIRKMDVVLANSQNVQTRLQKYCGVKSAVVYPPIDLEKFQSKHCHSERSVAPAERSEESIIDPSLPSVAQDDKKNIATFYLSFARLVDLKRVDDIARAFQQMPDKKLIIASGGPELPKIKQLAVGYKNIEVLGFVSDAKLTELVQGCIANIYIPKQEDFGMTPLEAAAAGKPTIGVDDGGLRETILHEKTGYLIAKDYQIADLVKAVQWLDFAKAASMADACRAQAEKFGKEKFVQEVRSVV